jgi:tRNA(Arg) A34 adenosine deaminase TadA
LADHRPLGQNVKVSPGPIDDSSPVRLGATDRAHLERCVELATEALAAGDDPFGSVLVGSDGTALAEARNRELTDNDPTAHPELELARWAAANLDPVARAGAAVYTSGEHCPMCAAAHAWVGLGAVVFAHSATQVAAWRAGWGLPPSPVRVLGIGDVAPGVRTSGPVPPYDERMRLLHEQAAARRGRA